MTKIVIIIYIINNLKKIMIYNSKDKTSFTLPLTTEMQATVASFYLKDILCKNVWFQNGHRIKQIMLQQNYLDDLYCIANQ